MSEQQQSVAFTKSPADIIQRQRLFEATPQVQYVSQGHCLVIGETDRALSVQGVLKNAGMTLVCVDPGSGKVDKQLTDDGIAVFTVPALSLEGYLGAYRAVVPANALAQEADFDLGVAVFRESGLFDVVLDLSPEPLLPMRLVPFGYKHVGSEQDIAAAAAELADMQGEFEKPRFFHYESSLCAYSRSELIGCHRCMDVCTTDAISSSGDGISIEPFLCQGCGSCATVCPSGAMSYAYPRPSDAIYRSRETLQAQQATTLVLHAEAHQSIVDGLPQRDGVVAMLVEEVSAFGVDYWLSMLAGPAVQIVVVLDWAVDDPNRLALESQIAWISPLFESLNIQQHPVHLVSPSMLEGALLQSTNTDIEDELSGGKPAGMAGVIAQDFDTHNDKRQTIRLALDALSEQLTPGESVVELPKGAPFGRVNVDQQACTLCMACVSTCPAKALQDGQDTPALRFVESNCLQCGLCETACPESAISLESRYVWDSIEARKVETLHEEQPFHCIRCHAAFSTQAMIDNMSAKLSDHWMFQNDKALRRLRLCGDCRVRDMFEDDAAGIAVHKDEA